MLIIDTGIAADDPRRFMPDWFLDRNDTGDTRRLVHDYAYHLIGALHDPKAMRTVRKHTVAQWSFLRHLADEWPEIFDEFWTVYAERFAEIA